MATPLQKLLLNKRPLVCNYTSKASKTLFETIALTHKGANNLYYHQKRVNRAFYEYFQCKRTIDLKSTLKSYLTHHNLEHNKKYRVKIVYNNRGIVEISLSPYTPKRVQKILLIELSNVNYSYKFTQRSLFERLHQDFDADEFLITQDGSLTDATIANIALYHSKDQQWHTPKTPLLKGTTRERLIEEQKIIERDIAYSSLDNYSTIALLNAMVNFKIL